MSPWGIWTRRNEHIHKVARRWIHDELLTLEMWKKIINADVLMYKMTYEARGASKKFRKVWFWWVDSADTLEGEG